MPSPAKFDHERLIVYQRSLGFISWLTDALEGVPRSVAAYGQLDRASTSIPLNLAEGNGRYTGADRCRFFDIARGSALECAAGLDLLVAKQLLNAAAVEAGKSELAEIVSMLVGLIRSNSETRLHEATTGYRIGGDDEKE